MYSIYINSDFLDELLVSVGKTAQEYCESFDFDYNLFLKIYNTDLSVTLKDLIRFANVFQIDMQELLII